MRKEKITGKYSLVIIFTVINIGVLTAVIGMVGRREAINQLYLQEELVLITEAEEQAYFYVSYDTKPQGIIAAPEITLPQGIYRVSATYEMIGSGVAYAGYSDGYYKNKIANVRFMESSNKFSYELHVDEAEKPVRVYFKLNDPKEGDYLLVRSIEIRTAENMAVYYGFLSAVFLFVLEALLWGLIKRKKILGYFRGLSGEQRLVGAVMLFTVILISLPVMTGYLNRTHDFAFHLMRIEGIKEGLLSGQFPVRISPGWMNHHGYAVSIFYGELLLYLPALLRLFGLPLWLAYSLYVVGINTAAVLIAWHCFRKISGRSYIGLMAAVFYAANPYRLTNIYVRGAVGEYTAMLFFPLIIYGWWRLLTEETEGEENRKIWKILVVGYSGVILSHTISTMICVGFTLLLCIVRWRKIFCKKTLLIISKTILAIILLNGWFLIPFADYIRFEWQSNTYDPAQAAYSIQKSVEFLPQFFMTDYNVDNAGASSYGDGSMRERMPVTIGMTSVIILAAGMMFKGKKGRRYVKQEIFVYFLTGFTMFTSSVLFPWMFLCRLLPVVNLIARVLQFSWRLNTVTVILLALLACLIAEKLEPKRELHYGFVIAVLIVSVWQGWELESRVLNQSQKWEESELTAGGFYQLNGEYLPFGGELADYVYRITGQSEAIEIIDWSSQRNTVRVAVENSGGASGFEVPLINYKGYQARDITGNQSLPITSGTSGRIRVEIPEGYGGTILVEFVPPWYWRVAEVITLLSVCGWAGLEMIKGKRCRRLLRTP